jgi:hypothetical protein
MLFVKKIALALALASVGSIATAQSCRPGEKWVCVKQGNETVCSCQFRF